VSDAKLLSLLIPAVGGQGGGVLSEWIVDAATIEGHLVHGTSIPGVAQRTGSTSYYVELFTGAEPPVFSLYPVPGALDVLLAPELLEVGRMIELGFPSPSRTTIIASTHRLYSIHEKVATGGGVYDTGRLTDAARAFSRALVAFDALAVSREHGTEVNAVLLGALAASGALPIGALAYRAAIEGKGVGVAANLKGFEVGLDLARRGTRAVVTPPAPALRSPARFADALAALPGELRPTVGEALARLLDYQDERYAARYLERLQPFVAGDRGLATLVARHLALWMTYEDAIRVADLKTRAARFERIRREAGGPNPSVIVAVRGEPRSGGEPSPSVIEVTDYLKPDLDELYGILPYRVVAPLARWAERRWPHGRPTLGQHVRTTTIVGFLRVWLLGRCRRWRPVSYRAHLEHARMERWLAAVRQCAEWNGDLARELAGAAQLVKGYGDVRRRMIALFDDLLATAMMAAREESSRSDGFALSTGFAAAYRRLVLKGPDGETEARALATTLRLHLEAHDYAGAFRLVSKPVV
jgi:indolepyruvate ferredoxin oxidoreductase beta subunit